MSKKLIYLISFILLLGLAFSNIASAVVIDPNFVGWWKLNETDCNNNALAYDSSGHGLNGYYRGLGPITATQVADRYGVPNYAKAFNVVGTLQGAWVKNVGMSDANKSATTFPLTDPNNVLLSPREQITMSFWMKGRRNPQIGETWETFIAKGDDSYRICRSASGNTAHVGLNGTSLGWFDGTMDINDGNWHHICATYNGPNVGAKATLYVDGKLDVAYPCTGLINATTDLLFFCANPAESNRLICGYLDNIRLYSRAVKQAELVYLAEELYPYAYDPDPADGATITTTTPTLKWRPGDSAASHKVYLDPNQQWVIARSGCQINGVSTTDPCYPITTPLTLDTTYYWAVDEVNDSTYQGPTWRFIVPGYEAHHPVPNNGATLAYRRDDANQTFGSLDVLMSWEQGIGAEAHNVYFDDFSPPTTLRATQVVTDTDWAPSEAGLTLEYGTTYYWQIDEVNYTTGITTGDEWHFTTIDADVGLIGEYYNNTELVPPPALVRKDLNINFDWGYGSPSPGTVNSDNFSVKWTADLNVPETNTYTFSIYCLGEDGVRLWVNEELIIDNWPHANLAKNQADIDLVKGLVPIRMEFRHTSWGASAKLFWKTPSMTSLEIIPVGAFFLHPRTDFVDFAMFATHWLETGCSFENNWCGGADLDGDEDVDFNDLKKLADNWLEWKL